MPLKPIVLALAERCATDDRDYDNQPLNNETILSFPPALNNKDLLKAIKAKQIRGAVLDVTSPEPLPEDSELWDCPEILITGHMSSAPGNKNSNPAFEAFEKNLDLYLAGKKEEMINQVDLKKGY